MQQTQRPRLYVGTACDQCFRCKSRCSGDRPTCMRCRNNQSACTYSTARMSKSDREASVSPRYQSLRVKNGNVDIQGFGILCDESKESWADTAVNESDFDGTAISSFSSSLKTPSSSTYSSDPPGFANVPSTSRFTSPSSPPLFMPLKALSASFDNQLFPHENESQFLHPSAFSTASEDPYRPLTSMSDNDSASTHTGDLSTHTLFAPQSVEIIDQLSKIKTSLTATETESIPSLDSVFLLTRRGLKIVSSSLNVYRQENSQSGRASLAEQRLETTTALGCISIMSLIITSYGMLRYQISSRSQSGKPIQIGTFHLEDDDLNGEVLTLVLTREKRHCKEVMKQLEAWVHQLVEWNHSENSLLLPLFSGLQITA